MHFQIPNTQVNQSGSGSFITFNIYINGTFHCSLRYRQLLQFHQQLKKAFGGHSLYEFPPKKMFTLTAGQLEERRSHLEKYIQIASQDSQIVNSDIFNGFLLAAQKETHSELCTSSTTYLEVYQLNWQSVRLSVDTNDNSHLVLRKYLHAIQLDGKYLPYFSLHLVRKVEMEYRTVRPLNNYESPYLTLHTVNSRCANHVILVRKSYWDSAYDEDLFLERTTLNIIYLQALYEIEKGYIMASPETRHKLTNLQAKGNKIEYLRLARTLKFYNYIHFEPCHCDHPQPNSSVLISAGNQELNIRLLNNSNEEFSFRVIRIKCWRITTSNNHIGNESSDGGDIVNNENGSSIDIESTGRFEFAFEYLTSKGNLKWITIHSSQAVLISSCLQSMVEEMLAKREGKKFRSEGLSLRYNTNPNYSSLTTVTTNSLDGTSVNDSSVWNYQLRDGTNVTFSATKLSYNNDLETTNQTQVVSNTNESTKMKNVKYNSVVENNIFDEIGDDDL